LPPRNPSLPLILVTNDDGIHAPGIRALAGAMEGLGTVYVVAPDRERSAAGHSLTISRPLRVEHAALRSWAVDGTPTDCVNLAVNGLLRRKKVDLVVSGINRGANMGDDVTYSGTVAAAMEGTLLGIPSVAFSLAAYERPRYEDAAAAAAEIVKKVLARKLPKDTLLNVNFPPLPREEFAGMRVTRMGKRVYGDAVVMKRDPRGRKYFWIGGNTLRHAGIPGSDLEAVEAGYVSITPLHLDLTNHDSLAPLRRWNW
jgi:5'-nucleotidase